MSTEAPAVTRRRSSVLPLATGAFMRKEAFDVLRQPRLLLTLVLGPFLILLAFGLGYRDEIRPFRTVFVGDPQSELGQRVTAAADDLGRYLRFEGVTADEADARARLEEGTLDAVVLLPDDPIGTVLGGERATLRVLHTRLDPVELTVIGFATRLAVAEVNAAVVASVVGQGQDAGAPLPGLLTGAQAGLGELSAAIDAGDAAAFDEQASQVADVLSRVGTVARAVEVLADESAGAATDAGAADAGAAGRSVAAAAGRAGAAIETARAAVADGRAEDARAAIAEAQQALDGAPELASQLLAVDASVLVQPFEGRIESTAPETRTFTDYYAPAAVVLLLQQFGVAFAALSFVRERQLGMTELYRVAPVGAPQVVLGKYLGHLLLGALLGTALTAMVIVVLDVPLAGALSALAVALALVLVAAVGLGFAISLTSRTDMQAVLATMLVLLASLFFSGFFLPVDQLSYPARLISWILPATYGIELARDVMLRGAELDGSLAGALAVYGAAIAVMVGLLTARRMSART